jgi:hypothetical protein
MDLVSVFCRQITTFQATFVEEAVFSQEMFLATLSKNKVGIAVWIHTRILYSIPMVFISVFVPLPCCFYCYYFII